MSAPAKGIYGSLFSAAGIMKNDFLKSSSRKNENAGYVFRTVPAHLIF
jgi:hypothetical protein